MRSHGGRDCSLATAEQHTNKPFSFGIFHTKRRDYFFDVGNEQDMIEWVQCIEKVLGVGQSGVSIEDFELLNMVGKGSYGRVIQVRTMFWGRRGSFCSVRAASSLPQVLEVCQNSRMFCEEGTGVSLLSLPLHFS
jgi:hypothetical protein